MFPCLTLTIFMVPVTSGLIGTWLPAFGYLPVIGAQDFSLHPFKDLFAHPSLPGALRSTLFSGLSATLFSLIISLWITAHLYGKRIWIFIERTLAPLLAIPHAAFAIGFTFLIAPSGWLVRLVSPTISGFTSPPDWPTNGDPWGLSLTITMILKEIPFLLFIIIGGISQLDTKRTIWLGSSLGYSRFRIWSRLIIPQLYPMLRLPVLAVLTYSLSVVDLALIIGPTVPPTFAVLIDHWFNSPEISSRLIGAAGATLLFVIVSICIGLSLAAEQIISRLNHNRLINGNKSSFLDRTMITSPLPATLIPGTAGLSILILLIWSFARSWRFPDSFPQMFSFFYWQKSLPIIYESLFLSTLIGLCSSVIAIVLVLGCFENEQRLSHNKLASITAKSLWIIYLPLLIPQVGFLFGAQTMFITLGIEGTWVGIIWIHLVFVLPYVFLTLANTYRNYDKRFFQCGSILSRSAWRSFVQIKLPMLLKPVLFSIAVGFAVSIAQYLPTLYVGAGRFATITTETVSLAGGSDRRVIAVYALCQFLLPLVIYTIAIQLPAFMFKNRKAMQN